MSTYIVSYDLRKQRDYTSLIKAIKNYHNWGKPLESLWVIVTEQTAEQVRDELARHMDSDDGLFVVKSGGVAAWRNVLCDGQWLKDNL